MGRKLTAEDVVLIRERLAVGASVKALADVFGVSRNTIASVGAGRTWPHTPGPRTQRPIGRRKANYHPPKIPETPTEEN